MKCNLCKNIKIALIVALSLIVVGMVFFGVFGFNKAVDNRVNYEVTVGVDQNIDNAGDKVKSTAEEYFKEIGAKYFNVQILDNGSAYTYVFTDNKVEADLLKDKIQVAVGDVVVASCKVTEVNPSTTNQAVNTIIALAIASAVIIIYLLIVEKVASTFTVILNAIFASVLCVALLALTRIPVFGDVEIYIAASFALSAVVSSVIANRLREKTSVASNEKLDYSEIVDMGIKDSAFRIIAFAILTVLSAIVLAVVLAPHLIYTAVYVLIAGIAAICASVLGTAIFWPILKNVKKKA